MAYTTSTMTVSFWLPGSTGTGAAVAGAPSRPSGFGGPGESGWDEVSQIFGWVASRFCDCTEYSFDLVAAGVSGDLAYTVGYERSSVSVDGGPVQPNILRVTHVYRREDGEWKLVHRHGDHLPVDQSPPAEASTG